MTAKDTTSEGAGECHGDDADDANFRRQSRESTTLLSWHSRLFPFCRTLGLRILPASTSSPEQPKVAIQHDCVNALIHCCIHVAPLTGAFVLIYLNLSWHYVSPDMPSESITALQFAAKLHEMIMVASLAAAFTSYTRHLLVSNGGLPFGVAFAHLQVMVLEALPRQS